ncbi:DUF2207 domain-containing protein [Peptostreptococcaceae bacterium OttesenSCG-928-C18]|nr:DUF2207 domain-containing protein [Peptostreptococcaceae bacterium OttesenSCG-928-C18]
MKKYFKLLFIVFALMLIPVTSYATELSSIDMNVKLTDTGDAIFTNKFVYDDNKGTEHYFVLDNLADSELKNFTVTRNGKEMKYKRNWNVDDSLEEKSGKYGIVTTSDGYELCYGISKYGKNEFVLSYTITNFVKQLEDTQMMYWEFISRNFSDEPKNIKVVIEKEGFEFEYSNSKIWAFGYNGDIVFKNGKIIASTTGKLNSGNKITVLTKFDEQIFSPTSKIDKDFNYYKEMAFKGSSYDINEDGNGGEAGKIKSSNIVPKIFFSLIFLAILVTVVILRILAKKVKSEKYLGEEIDKIEFDKSDYKKEYYKEVPYEGNLSNLYILIDKCWNVFENYMTVYFLKWLSEDKIKVIKEEKRGLFKKEEISFEILDLEYIPEDYLEKQLYRYMLQAAKRKNILNSKDFGNWISSNNEKIDNLIEKAMDNSRKELTKLGYLEVQVKVNTFTKYRKTVLTETGKELVGNLVKFENYLKDYSLLNERESYNIHIWDKYMIYAALFGVTKEVEKEFSNIYPEYVNETYYDFYTIYYINRMSSKTYGSYASASQSLGSGGGASFGGGGGSFGGGGGGTR